MDLLTPTLPYNQWLQQFPFLLLPMKFFSVLGTELCYLALLPIIYWAVSRPLGARLGALLLFSSIANEIFKVGFALPRPYWLVPSLQLSTQDSFGFPSGHAQNAWLLWPYVALQARNRRLWIPLSLLLALCITVSRNYLGVHFLADSVGGALIGLTILGLTRAGGPAWLRFWRQLSTFQKVFFALLATGFLAGIYAMAMYRGASPYFNGYGVWSGPDYQKAIENALAGGNIANRLGGFCGLLVGVSFAARLLPAEAQMTLRILAPRLALGFIGLIAFYKGFQFVLPKSILSNFVNYFATTFWITFGAPWVFEKLMPNERRVV